MRARQWCEQVNARAHRETGVAADRAAGCSSGAICTCCRPIRTSPALGEERLVNDDQTIRFGSVRYSTPPGFVGGRVWCRVVGHELAVVAMTGAGTVEIARHRLSTPGRPQHPRRRTIPTIPTAVGHADPAAQAPDHR